MAAVAAETPYQASDAVKAIKVKYEKLGLKGTCKVRDLWRQRDLGEFGSKFETTIFRHGVTLVKITPR